MVLVQTNIYLVQSSWSKIIHFVKKVPGINHSKRPLKEIVSLSQVCFAIFPIDKNIKQRICLKLFISNGISCAEMLKMFQKA